MGQGTSGRKCQVDQIGMHGREHDPDALRWEIARSTFVLRIDGKLINKSHQSPGHFAQMVSAGGWGVVSSIVLNQLSEGDAGSSRTILESRAFPELASKSARDQFIGRFDVRLNQVKHEPTLSTRYVSRTPATRAGSTHQIPALVELEVRILLEMLAYAVLELHLVDWLVRRPHTQCQVGRPSEGFADSPP